MENMKNEQSLELVQKSTSENLDKSKEIKIQETSPGLDSRQQTISPNPTISPQPVHRRIFKIIVIGDSNVGKTCLTFRFCGGKFLERSEATIGVDFREKTIQIDDETIKLQLWDTGKIFIDH